MKLTKRDIELIKCLRTNARLTLTQISKKTKIPISTLFEHLKKQENGLIAKHTTLVDFSMLGYDTRLQLLVKMPTDIKENVKNYLYTNDSINTICTLGNTYDLCVEAIFKRVQDAKAFVDDLQERFPSLEASSHFIVEDVKREAFIPQTVPMQSPRSLS